MRHEGDPVKQSTLYLRGSTLDALDGLPGTRSENADRLLRKGLGLDKPNRNAARKG